MKYPEKFSHRRLNWPNQLSDRRSMAETRKLARHLHAMDGSIDPDLRDAINFVRSGRTPITPDTSIEELVQALRDEELSVRADAAHQLGMRGENVPVEPLLNALHDEQRFVRAQAAQALGKLGEGVPLVPLVTALQDEDGSVRVATAQALGMLGKRVPLEDLKRALNDSWPPVREATVLALGKLEELVSLETFMPFLHDEDKYVRMAVLSVLGTLEGRVPIKPLVAALRDGQKQVRKAAQQALLARGKRKPIVVFRVVFLGERKWQSMRKATARILCTLGKRLPSGLCKYASSCEWTPIRATVTLLKRSLVPTSTDQLLCTTTLSSHKPDPAKIVIAMQSRNKRPVKSKMEGRFMLLEFLQLTTGNIPGWAKQNKTSLWFAFVGSCVLFVIYHRKRILPSVKGIALYIFRLPRTT